MRLAITNALIEQEALALQMRQEISDAVAQAWPSIVSVMLTVPLGEREAVMADIVMSITADVISEYGVELEDESEAQAAEITKSLTGIAGNA